MSEDQAKVGHQFARAFSRGESYSEAHDDDELPPPAPDESPPPSVTESNESDGEESYDPRAPNVPRTPKPDGKGAHSHHEGSMASIVHRAKKSDDDEDDKTEVQRSGGGGRVISTFCCCISRGSDLQNEELPMESSDELVRKYCGRVVLPPATPANKARKCLVLDLDETLLHSSFRQVGYANYIIPVNIENKVHNIYVLKRPCVDEFLKKVAEHFEIIIYTASLSKYADPLLDQLDTEKVIQHRLFRESCTFHDGMYVKNLSLLDRDLSQTIIVDNSPVSYMFHPRNAIGCYTWTDEMEDRELEDIGDFLVNIKDVPDVRSHLQHWRKGGDYRPSHSASKLNKIVASK